LKTTNSSSAASQLPASTAVMLSALQLLF